MSVICPYCSREFKGNKLNSRHLSKCNPASRIPVPLCLCGHKSTSLTQMKRHRSKCSIWKTRDKKVVAQKRRERTLVERYGVTSPRHIGGAEEKRKKTIQERYGAENVFSKESTIFNKVQASLEGKRPILKGQDNPFAWESTKKKIKQTMLDRHGVESPQQSPEIRSQTRATNLERYGVEEILASPEIRTRIRDTCEERYGGPSPSCDPGVQAKQRETNMERYGVPWTCMDPEIRRKQMETHFEHYGGVHFFASEEGLQKIREGMTTKYGVSHPAKIDGFWERQVERFKEKYGVSHPLQLAEFLEKRRETCQERYGVDSPLQNPEVMAKVIATCQERYGVNNPFSSDDIKQKIIATNQERFGSDYFVGSEAYKEWSRKLYGTDHPMQNQKYALQHLKKMSRPGINRLEQKVANLVPSLLYTGDGSWWRWLPKLNHHKNPDFILPGPHPDNPKKGVTKAVEIFGDYWHSKIFTGKAPFDHEQELIEAFADIGIECLVIWESEVKADKIEVQKRIKEFLRETPQSTIFEIFQ